MTSLVPRGIGTPITGLYGVIAEFNEPASLLAAATAARQKGYRDIDAFSPYPVHGLAEAIGAQRSALSFVVLAMGVVGGLSGFFMCWYANVITYPWNVGGRPLNSWPAWIPITFECTVLVAAFGAVFGMLALNGLPMPYHPVFNLRRFDQATRDKFFLVIQARDPKFNLDEVRDFLDSLNPREVIDVPW